MTDLKMTDDGELVIGPDGDLDIVWGDEHLAQEILFRLKTQAGDWVLSPEIGADLEDFIGQPNDGLIHSMIENRIVRALSFDSLVAGPDVTVTGLSENEVMVVVEFPSREERSRVIQIASQLDLRVGVVFARVGSRQI
jgi:phage baseplate assembly protein W